MSRSAANPVVVLDAAFNSQVWTRLKLAGKAPLERAELGVTLALVGLGIWLRARGYLFSTEALWLDEAGWATHLIEDPLASHLIRPIAFMALTKALVGLFGASEAALRALPWAAGLATTLMAPVLARRLFQSAAARLLFVGILALDPAAIDLSKEFKPYSVSLALHAAFLLAVLTYRDSRLPRDLAWALALSVPGVLFAQDAVFAYPGVFVVLGVDAIHRKKWRHLFAVATAALTTIGIIGSLYFFVWRKLDRAGDEAFWGKKYDVFFVPPKTGPGDQVGWLSDKYAKLAETAGERNITWSSERWTKTTVTNLKAVDDLLWLTL
ncbi:MAG TPA: glycosyltransferase family 39 protein, partial [Polyangiaceae bacterium]